MLTFNLKKEWFEKIARGEKRIEYREKKYYWDKRIANTLGEKVDDLYFFENYKIPCSWWESFGQEGIPCVFCRAYPPAHEEYDTEQRSLFRQFLDNMIDSILAKLTRIHGTISKIEIVDGKDTDLQIDKPVYAIHFKLDGEK